MPQDIGNLAARPFEDNAESNKEVDHYHAHGKGCEDLGHHLCNGKHELPHEVYEKDKENEGEHGYPEEDTEEEKGDHKGEYPGFIRKIR